MKVRASAQIDGWRALAALTAGNSLGILTLYLIPLTIGASVEGFGVRVGTAGMVSSWELGAMAAASLIATARLHRLAARRWAVLGMLVFLFANLVSAWSVVTADWVVFLACRGAVGAAEGVLFAVTSGLAAQTADPDRTFSWFAGFHVVLAGVGLVGVGLLVDAMGPTGAFVAVAGISASLLPLMPWTPADTAARVESAARPEPSQRWRGRTALTLLGGVALFSLALNTLYPYAERIGAAIGIPLTTVSFVLSLGTWLSVLGPVASGLTGTRFGRTVPIAFGIVVQAVGALVVVHTTSFAWWSGAQIVTATALLYFLPFLHGLVAAHDPTGSLNAASATIISVVSAVGPLVGGIALNAGSGFVLLGWASALVYAATFVLIYRPSRDADRALRASTAEGRAEPRAELPRNPR